MTAANFEALENIDIRTRGNEYGTSDVQKFFMAESRLGHDVHGADCL